MGLERWSLACCCLVSVSADLLRIYNYWCRGNPRLTYLGPDPVQCLWSVLCTVVAYKWVYCMCTGEWISQLCFQTLKNMAQCTNSFLQLLYNMKKNKLMEISSYLQARCCKPCQLSCTLFTPFSLAQECKSSCCLGAEVGVRAPYKNSLTGKKKQAYKVFN